MNAERPGNMKIFSPIRLVLAVAALMSVFSAPAFARVEININKGNVEPLPIAIT
ncbi:MAG: Tol-Pal system protein TolB, partial [Agrobacterium sp.]